MADEHLVDRSEEYLREKMTPLQKRMERMLAAHGSQEKDSQGRADHDGGTIAQNLEDGITSGEIGSAFAPQYRINGDKVSFIHPWSDWADTNPAAAATPKTFHAGMLCP